MRRFQLMPCIAYKATWNLKFNLMIPKVYRECIITEIQRISISNRRLLKKTYRKIIPFVRTIRMIFSLKHF